MESDGADGRGVTDSSWFGLVFARPVREQKGLIPCEASCDSHVHSGEPLFFPFFFSLRLSLLQGFRLLPAVSPPSPSSSPFLLQCGLLSGSGTVKSAPRP